MLQPSPPARRCLSKLTRGRASIRRVASAAAFALVLLTAARAVAAPDAPAPPDSRWKAYWKARPASPHRLKLDLELGLLLVSLPVWAITHYINPQLDPPSCGQPGHLCDRNAVAALDRGHIYANADYRPISEWLFSWTMPILALGLMLDYGPYRWDSYLTDMMIAFESLAVTAAVTLLVRTAVRRPRPYLYVDGAYPPPDWRDNPDATLSFWSGHVAYLFAFGVSVAYLFTLRHGWRSPWTYVVWTAALGAGVASAVTRVGAGDHFVSDVLVGAAFGSGVGLLVPLAHPRRASANVTIAPLLGDRVSGLAVIGRF